MRKLVYIFIALLLISCANNKKEVPTEAIESVDMEKTETVFESAALEDKKEAFSYQYLTEQKLQDYYDLLVLQQQHPEFKEDITAQLQELSNDVTAIPDSTQKITIKNVQQMGATLKISDSVQKIRLLFDIVTESTNKRDSITAIVSTKKVYLDQQEVISTKVVFEKQEVSN